MAQVVAEREQLVMADVREQPVGIRPLHLQAECRLVRAVGDFQHAQGDVLVRVPGVGRGVGLREQFPHQFAGGGAQDQRDLPCRKGRAGRGQWQAWQLQRDAVDVIGQRGELQGAGFQAQGAALQGQPPGVRQAQAGIEVIIDGRAVGPQLILRRQALSVDDDRRAAWLGQYLLQAQGHTVPGDLHRGRQHPGLLQVHEADAGHVAEQPLYLGPHALGAHSGQRHSHGEQQAQGYRRPATLAQRLYPSSPPATEGRLSSSTRFSQHGPSRKELALQVGDESSVRGCGAEHCL